MSRISQRYKVYDHKENKTILTEATIVEVVAKIDIPYAKVSPYSISGYKYKGRYTIEKADIVLDKIMDDLYVTLMFIKNSASEDRFHKLKFSKKRERQAG